MRSKAVREIIDELGAELEGLGKQMSDNPYNNEVVINGEVMNMSVVPAESASEVFRRREAVKRLLSEEKKVST